MLANGIVMGYVIREDKAQHQQQQIRGAMQALGYACTIHSEKVVCVKLGTIQQ